MLRCSEIIDLQKPKGYPIRIPFSAALKYDLWIISKHVGLHKTKEGKFTQWKDYAAYVPDLIIKTGHGSQDMIFIEYVNREGSDSSNVLRCLRGMLALEFTMCMHEVKDRKLYLALLDSIYAKNWKGIPRWSKIEFIKISELIKCLEGRQRWP